MKWPAFIGPCMLLLALAANAAEEKWFDAKIGTYTSWPTNDTAFGGTWSSNAVDTAQLEGNGVSFDADAELPLAFSAEHPKTLGANVNAVRVSSRMSFRPFPADDLPDIPTGTKAGIIAVKGNVTNSYYVILSDGTNNQWRDSALIASTNDVEVTVTIATNGTDTVAVTYEIGTLGTVSGLTRDSDGEVTAVSFAGRGKVQELSAQYAVLVRPLEPGTNVVEVLAESEKDALDQVEIIVPNEAKSVVSDEAAYVAMFRKKTTDLGNGFYRIKIVFNPSNMTVMAMQKAVDTTTRELDLSGVMTGDTGTATFATTTPGVYYVLEADGKVNALAPVDEQMGTGGPLNLTMPTYPGAGFYRLRISPKSLLKK